MILFACSTINTEVSCGLVVEEFNFFYLEILGRYSPIIPKNILGFFSPRFCKFESNTTCDKQAHMVKPVRSFVTFK